MTRGALDWARDLLGRAGFAPVIFLSEQAVMTHALTRRVVSECTPFWDSTQIEKNEFVHAVTHSRATAVVARAVWRRPSADATSSDSAALSFAAIATFGALPRDRCRTCIWPRASRPARWSRSKWRATGMTSRPSSIDSFRRFLQEYEIVQRIRHPNIVRLYDLGVSDEHAWLVMEYFRAGDLRRRMRAGLHAARGAAHDGVRSRARWRPSMPPACCIAI